MFIAYTETCDPLRVRYQKIHLSSLHLRNVDGWNDGMLFAVIYSYPDAPCMEYLTSFLG